MPIDPALQMLADQMATAGAPPMWELDATGAREAFAMVAAASGTAGELAEIRDLEVPGAGGELGARLYRPHGATGALLVYFHGGGFVIGDLESHDPICRQLAERSGATVVAVDYRLGPEHRFPAAHDDCVAAATWLLDHAAELGADPSRIAIGGDSAGGNLAAATALALRGHQPGFAFQMLLYPCLDARCGTPSHLENAAQPFLPKDLMDWFYANYVTGDADRTDPRLSPVLADDLAGAPPAYVVTAELDILRDEGEYYAERLQDAGVDVRLERVAGATHGFVQFAGVAPIGQATLAAAADAVKAALA
jgi:acetyl esterase